MGEEQVFSKILSILVKSVIIIVGITGIIVTCVSTGFMGSGVTFLYFTVQSNVFAIAVALLFLVDSLLRLLGKKPFVTGVMRLIKFTATIAVTVTFLVFATMLAPLMGLDYLLSYSNFSLHVIVPILMMFDFLYFDKDVPLNRFTCLWGVAPALAYFVFFLIGSVAGIRYLNNGFAPYFFLDYQANGWFRVSESGLGTAYWFLILLVLIAGLCYLFLLFMNLRRGTFKKRVK